MPFGIGSFGIGTLLMKTASNRRRSMPSVTFGPANP
jgi:hypothetical protein